MSYQAVIHANQRRVVLTLLSHDSDYTLSDVTLHTAMAAVGEGISIDSLATHTQWLEEQGFVTLEQGISYQTVTLTNRGLDVAKGVARAHGVRDLLPSELNKMK